MSVALNTGVLLGEQISRSSGSLPRVEGVGGGRGGIGVLGLAVVELDLELDNRRRADAFDRLVPCAPSQPSPRVRDPTRPPPLALSLVFSSSSSEGAAISFSHEVEAGAGGTRRARVRMLISSLFLARERNLGVMKR